MEIIEAVKTALKEYKNLRSLEHPPEFLQGYLQGLLVILDPCTHPDRDELKEEIRHLRDNL